MPIILIVVSLLLSTLSMAQPSSRTIPAPNQGNFGYLKAEDQKYFKNDSMEGRNQLERIDLNVAELNKLHAEIARLKAQMHEMQKSMAELKKNK